MTLEELNRKMPFVEAEGYVDRLVEGATEQAISKGKTKKARSMSLRRTLIAAASVLLVVGLSAVLYLNQPEDKPVLAHDQTPKQEPLDAFLNSISDKEAQMIDYYELEEIEYTIE